MSEHPESPFTHPLCEDCFTVHRPHAEPVKLREPEVEKCCFCGEETSSGIYYRAAPSEMNHCPHNTVPVCAVFVDVGNGTVALEECPSMENALARVRGATSAFPQWRSIAIIRPEDIPRVLAGRERLS